MNEMIYQRIRQSIDVKQQILNNNEMVNLIESVASVISDSIVQGGKIVICGNGGSASDALHFAGEMIGRFQCEREAWPAIALNADVASMTSIANDYGFDDIFVRQAKALLRKKDILVAISTSGESKNVLRAVEYANKRGNQIIALLGGTGGEIGKISTYPIIVPSSCTARVQECHITIIHIWCELVELQITKKKNKV